MFERKNFTVYVGIDTGVETGMGVWHKPNKTVLLVQTVEIHLAMEQVLAMHHIYPGMLFIRVEDARLRKWIPKNKGREVLQGVGSVKRDAQVWEGFLKHHGINYEMVAPKDNKTKMDETYFKKVTGWTSRTSNHGRDALMLVFGI